MKAQRLSRDSWIEAGFAALPMGGADVLRAEPMARRLGTTKGSFYWHFADVPAYHAAMLDSWKRRSFAAIVAQMEQEGSTPDRLRRFGEMVLDDTAGAALRGWALSNSDAATTVAQVDAERLAYIRTLLSGLGVTNPSYARAAYLTLMGGQSASDGAADAYEALIDLVLVLR